MSEDDGWAQRQAVKEAVDEAVAKLRTQVLGVCAIELSGDPNMDAVIRLCYLFGCRSYDERVAGLKAAKDGREVDWKVFQKKANEVFDNAEKFRLAVRALAIKDCAKHVESLSTGVLSCGGCDDEACGKEQLASIAKSIRESVS